jgi:hypothetical protein
LAVDYAFDSPLPHGDGRPRGLTILLGAIAVVEAIVIFAGAAVLLAKPIAHHLKNVALSQPPLKLTKAQVGPSSPVGKATLSRAKTTVLVLNGNGVTGAAGEAAKGVRQAGYKVRTVGNASRSDYPHSLVMFRAGFRPEAVRFGRDLGVKTVGPLDGMRVGSIHGAKLVYVVGARG